MDLDLNLVKKEQNDLKIYPVHYINVPNTNIETATLGMGCYWSAESIFGATNGVMSTRVGYSGGKLKFNHKDIGDHTEVVEIKYNPTIITYKNLLDIFWKNHEYLIKPKNNNEMSLILYHNDEQKKIAIESKKALEKFENVTTHMQEASQFYPSEDNQQKYKLQNYKDLTDSLELNSELLQISYVATKLNGFIAGAAGIDQFLSEVKTFGLTPTQIEYVKYYLIKNHAIGLSC